MVSTQPTTATAPQSAPAFCLPAAVAATATAAARRPFVSFGCKVNNNGDGRMSRTERDDTRAISPPPPPPYKNNPSEYDGHRQSFVCVFFGVIVSFCVCAMIMMVK